MMFKDKYIHKLYAFALAAVFALTLAGCGGGGTAAMPDPEPPVVEPEPTPQETCEADGGRYNADGSCTSAEDLAAEMTEAEALSAAQEAAMAAYMAAMAAVAGAKDPVAAANAQMYADAAMAASAAAAAATDSAMAMEHRMAAEAASASAVEAGMTRGLGITKLANANANQAAIDSAALVGTPAPAPVPNAGRVGAAIKTAAAAKAGTADDTVSTAVTDPATEDTTYQGTGSTVAEATGAVTLTNEVTVSARHTGTAPRFTVETSLLANNRDQVKLGRGEAPTALTMRGGWAGAELVASVSGTAGYKQNAVVYTDINPPAQTYNSDGAINLRDLDEDGTLDEVTADNANVVDTVVNQAVITGEVPGDGSHFVGTYNANPSDNAPPRPGRFFCATGEACSISVDASGVVRAIQGYVFQPAVAGSIMRGDSDYLAWGYWLRVPNRVPALEDDATTGDVDERAPAQVAAFASGNKPFNVKAALTGTATYNGVAAGMYTAAGMVEHFEADASLTADFGGKAGNDSDPTTAMDDKLLFGAVTGSISNIKAGGMDVEGSLTLGKAPLKGTDGDGAPATPPDPATSFNGSTAGSLGGSAMTGSWTGRFYGPNKAPDGSVAVHTEFPTTAAGTFGATSVLSGGASILGSFGTWKAE